MALTKYIAQTVPERVGRAYLSTELRRIQNALDSVSPELATLREEIAALDSRLAIFEAPLTWTNVSTFNNGWTNFGGGWAPAAYAKDALGFVHVRGLIKDGAAGQIFLLPAGFRPPVDLLFPTFANTLLGRVDVLSDGSFVAAVVPAGSNAYFAINISFFVGN